MSYKRSFIVGETYLTKSGKPVTIVEESVFRSPYYTTVRGDDGLWRWDRYQDIGKRCSPYNDECNDLVAKENKCT